MRIGLATFEFKNRDILFNLSQIERGVKEASGKVDLLCFGEAFLQGFDSLCWEFEADKRIAIEQDSERMNSVCKLSKKYGLDLIFGYIEREDDRLYSSCAVIEKGCLSYNYRRISRGWKEYLLTDDHYKEGDDVVEFIYKGNSIMLAICGDMWDYLEMYKTNGLIIWPVFLNFTLEEWEQVYEVDYAQQALLCADRVLMINSISHETEPGGIGGSFYFINGMIKEKAEYGKESILIVEV
ncbi:MAG: carbon-nitrogen hydrolase family protein [Tissierellia bacterium]|nr:carbon-nitrogen hydrolase family protein [Bacillota bacterium]NLL23464.1 carbon-nitrogen hydrolase family protein [Tissierellia bacterium]